VGQNQITIFFYPDTDCGLEVVKSKITTA